MSTDRQRLSITLVWATGLIASVGVVLSYLAIERSGVRMLAWHDVTEVLKSVLAVYATYLGGIIVFWFAKPFKTTRSTSRERIRFWIAMVGAVLVNAAYVTWLAIGYWNSDARLDDVVAARNVVIWLSFVVAPANLYFFGMRNRG